MAVGDFQPIHDRGDVLFLTNNTQLAVGDLIAFQSRCGEEDKRWIVVHRITKVHKETFSGEMLLLTKGDTNRVDDRGLYTPGQLYLRRKCVVGKVVGQVRYIGVIPLFFGDFFWLRLMVMARGITTGHVGTLWWVSLLWSHFGIA